MTSRGKASSAKWSDKLTRLPSILKQLTTYGIRRSARFYHESRHWRDADRFKGSADLFTVLIATKRFVRKDLLQLLQLEPDAPVHMELPLSGSQSLTVILTTPAGKTVLRVYPFVMKDKAEAHADGANLLRSHGVNAPEILFCSRDSTQSYPVIFIVEEFVTGDMQRGAELTQENTRAMAVQLARMHSIQNQRWGRVGAERNERFFPPLMQRIKRDLETLERKGILQGGDGTTVKKWFGAWESDFETLQKFSLTHNDLQPANGIFTPAGDYYMVDLNRMQWGPAAREVVRCYHRQLRRDPEKIAEFNEAYFSALKPDDAQTTQNFCPFYEMFHRVSTLVKMAAKTEKIPDLRARNSERQTVIRQELLDLVRSVNKADI